MRNKDVTFRTRDKKHDNECAICGRRRLGKSAAAAVFGPDERPEYAAVYCVPCVRGLALAAGLL